MRATDQAVAIATTVNIQYLAVNTTCENPKPVIEPLKSVVTTSTTAKMETATKVHGIHLWMDCATPKVGKFETIEINCRAPKPSDGLVGGESGSVLSSSMDDQQSEVDW